MTENKEVGTTEQLTKLLREQQGKIIRAWFHSQMQPNSQNEAVHHANLPALRTIEKQLRGYRKPRQAIEGNWACTTSEYRSVRYCQAQAKTLKAQQISCGT